MRENGLRFGVTNHASWAARWLQPAYGYDGEGPLEGVRYDAYTLTKADGKGKWWEGLDPQDLYTGNSVRMPDGIHGAAAVRAWYNRQHQPRQRAIPCRRMRSARTGICAARTWWTSTSRTCSISIPTNCRSARPGWMWWRTTTTSAPRATAGGADVVVNGKHIQPAHVGAFVEDIERSTANAIRPDPWQTDTCIGDWHYSRAIAEQNRYATVPTIVSMLTDIVSKNGNLMLNIPLRGDGSIDEKEEAFLAGFTAWMDVNSEGIFATRPWKKYGEGPVHHRAACPRLWPCRPSLYRGGHPLHR